MSSGFLVSEALGEALRKPYHKGDMDVTIQYLVEGLKVGEYRVMLKRNFDTACWVPPVGKRAAHSIYYGDQMLDRVFDYFITTEKVEGMPELKDLAAAATLKLEAKNARLEAAAKANKKKFIPQAVRLSKTDILNEKVSWLKSNLTPKEWDKLLDRMVLAVASYGRHERQHARNTPQDLKQVNRDLRTLGIPFTYFNLFEDARIEHISRQELGVPFRWMEIEDIAPVTNPMAMFLRCIQLEGARDDVALDSEEPFAADDARTVGAVADSVEGYYKRACGCVTAEALYPIITEFLTEFKKDLPPPPPDPGSGSGSGGKGKGKGSPGSGAAGGDADGDGEGGSGGESGPDNPEDYNGAESRAGDLSTAAEAAEKGDEFFTEFEEGTEVVGGTDAEGKSAEAKAKSKLKGEGNAPPPKGPGSNAQGVPESIAPQASGGRAEEQFFLAAAAGSVDEVFRKRVDHVTGMLMQMFKTHNLQSATENPGRRMSGRHLARGELKFLHKRVFGGKGKRRYDVVYDCSGSMSGRPDREGKVLLLALNNLAKRGYLKGSLILSGWVSGQPGWLQYEFPVKDDLILRIRPSHASEGIQDALKDNLKHIKNTDDVFVYTDACICDAPLNRAYFAKNKVWPVGLYVGKTDMAAEMERHFPQNIIRNTIEEVVEAMLIRNRRTVG